MAGVCLGLEGDSDGSAGVLSNQCGTATRSLRCLPACKVDSAESAAALASGCKTLAFAKTHAVRAGKSRGTSTGPGLLDGEPRSLEDPEPALGRLVALGLDLGLQGLALGGRVLDALLLDLLLLAEHVGQEIFLLGFGL